MSKLAIEICLVFVDLWTQTTPNLRDQKWTVRPEVMFTFDAEPKKFSEKWTLFFYMHFLMEKSLKLTGKMLTRFFGFPLMQLPFQKRLEPSASVKAAIWAAPFLISDRISKKAQLFYRVFRKLSCVNLPGFLWRSSHKNLGFFYFQKGRWLSVPFSQPFFCFREDGFFVF